MRRHLLSFSRSPPEISLPLHEDIDRRKEWEVVKHAPICESDVNMSTARKNFALPTRDKDAWERTRSQHGCDKIIRMPSDLGFMPKQERGLRSQVGCCCKEHDRCFFV